MTIQPLYGFVEGDTMGVIVLGRLDESVADLGVALLRAVAVRVRVRGTYRIMAGSRRLDPAATLRSQALSPLDRIDLVWEEEVRA